MDSFKSDAAVYLKRVLTTRTGFLGLGPTYGEIIIASVIEALFRKHQGRSVVKEAEKIIHDINERNTKF